MKFTCLREDILSAVMKAEKAVSPKSTLAVMEGILIEAEIDKVYISGNDLEIAIEASFQARVEKTGRIVLNSRMFTDIIRKTGGVDVTFEVGENYHTTITSGPAVFKIAGINADEFPDTYDFEISDSIIIENKVLKDMIRQSIFAASKDTFRQILTGELFRVKDGVLNVVAIDGHRFAIRREPLVKAGDVKDFVVPHRTLNELMKILSDEGEIEIFPSKKYIMFEFRNCKLFSRTLEGDFFDYENLVKTECSIKLKTNVRELKSSFERVLPILYDEKKAKSPVRLTLYENEITVDCVTLTGTVHDRVDVEKLYGGDIEIGFVNQYLLDAFSACDEEEVFVEFSTPLQPMLLTPVEGDKFFYFILPVVLKK